MNEYVREFADRGSTTSATRSTAGTAKATNRRRRGTSKRFWVTVAVARSGTRLERSETRMLGADRCDFRFRSGTGTV